MKRKNKGSTLVLVVVIGAILSILSVALGTSMTFEGKHAITQQKKTQAYYIARAGAAATAKAITSMTSQELTSFNALPFPLNSAPQSFGGGTFQTVITQQGSLLTIISTGKIANGVDSNGNIIYASDTATIALNKSGNNISSISNAVFGIDSFKITGGFPITGDIGVNSYQAGAIATDNSQFKITGKVNIPPGGDPNIIISSPINPTVNIKPKAQQSSSLYNYPSPSLPTFPNNLPSKGSLDIDWSNNGMILNGSGYYSSIKISSNYTITINTNNTDVAVRIGDLNIVQGNINIAGTGKVTLYVDKCSAYNGALNNNGNEKQVVMYCNNTGTFTLSGGSVQIYASMYFGTTNLVLKSGAYVKGDIITAGTSVSISGTNYGPGVLYAPNASIIIENLSDGGFVGAIVGKNVTCDGGIGITMTQATIQTQVPIQTATAGIGNYTNAYWK